MPQSRSPFAQSRGERDCAKGCNDSHAPNFICSVLAVSCFFCVAKQSKKKWCPRKNCASYADFKSRGFCMTCIDGPNGHQCPCITTRTCKGCQKALELGLVSMEALNKIHHHQRGWKNCPVSKLLEAHEASQEKSRAVELKKSSQKPIVSEGRFVLLDEKETTSSHPSVPLREHGRQQPLQKLAGGGAPVSTEMDFSVPLPSKEKTSVDAVEITLGSSAKKAPIIDYSVISEKARYFSIIQETLEKLPFIEKQSPTFMKNFFKNLSALDTSVLKSMLENDASWDENLSAILQQVESQFAEELDAEQQRKHFELVNKLGDELSLVVHDKSLLDLMMSKISELSYETLEAMADPSRNDFNTKMDEIDALCKKELEEKISFIAPNDGW